MLRAVETCAYAILVREVHQAVVVVVGHHLVPGGGVTAVLGKLEFSGFHLVDHVDNDLAVEVALLHLHQLVALQLQGFFVAGRHLAVVVRYETAAPFGHVVCGNLVGTVVTFITCRPVRLVEDADPLDVVGPFLHTVLYEGAEEHVVVLCIGKRAGGVHLI